jgi:tetratricopeptide (TPR) repeat protein
MQNRLQQLQEMLAQEPDDVFLQYAIAIEYFSVNEFEKALVCLKDILQSNPEYLAAYYQTGKCYEELKQFENAKAMYNQGIELAIKQQKTKTLNELREALFLLEDD